MELTWLVTLDHYAWSYDTNILTMISKKLNNIEHEINLMDQNEYLKIKYSKEKILEVIACSKHKYSVKRKTKSSKNQANSNCPHT